MQPHFITITPLFCDYCCKLLYCSSASLFYWIHPGEEVLLQYHSAFHYSPASPLIHYVTWLLLQYYSNMSFCELARLTIDSLQLGSTLLTHNIDPVCSLPDHSMLSTCLHIQSLPVALQVHFTCKLNQTCSLPNYRICKLNCLLDYVQHN